MLINNNIPNKILLIGGNSLLGGALVDLAKREHINLRYTSRNFSHCDAIFFEIGKNPDSLSLKNYNHLVLVAGINGFSACENDPVSAARINALGQFELAEAGMINGLTVTFISSSAVFSDQHDLPDENTCQNANTLYGSLKQSTELGIYALRKKYKVKCNIIRISKILSKTAGNVEKWITASNNNDSITVCSDTFIYPVSLNYVAQSVIKILSYNTGGTFHLSSDDQISYLDLFSKFVESKILYSNSFDRIVLKKQNKAQYFKAEFAKGLSMSGTSLATGIQPQKISECISDISLEKR